jgi:hypothetical protein
MFRKLKDLALDAALAVVMLGYKWALAPGLKASYVGEVNGWQQIKSLLLSLGPVLLAWLASNAAGIGALIPAPYGSLVQAIIAAVAGALTHGAVMGRIADGHQSPKK